MYNMYNIYYIYIICIIFYITYFILLILYGIYYNIYLYVCIILYIIFDHCIYIYITGESSLNDIRTGPGLCRPLPSSSSQGELPKNGSASGGVQQCYTSAKKDPKGA